MHNIKNMDAESISYQLMALSHIDQIVATSYMGYYQHHEVNI